MHLVSWCSRGYHLFSWNWVPQGSGSQEAVLMLRVVPQPRGPFGLAPGARGWVAGCTGCSGFLLPRVMIVVAVPEPLGTELPFATLALNIVK